jgi:transposase-like protein
MVHPSWFRRRSNQYLNDLIDHDPRAIKRRCSSMAGFNSLGSAAITLTGIELAYRIRKRQFCFGPARQRRHASLKELWDRALA